LALISAQETQHTTHQESSHISRSRNEHIHQMTPYNWHILEDSFKMSKNNEPIMVKKGWLIAF